MNRRNLFKMLGTLTGGLLLRKAVPPLEALQLLAEKPAKPGVQVRYIRSYDPATHGAITRMDVLHGWAECYPDTACRMVS